MKWLDPISRGMAVAVGSVWLAASIASWVKTDLEPSPELLRTLAGIGASIFLAYVIEATWLATRFDANKRSEYFLGAITGLAALGFLGVAFALWLSDRPSSESFRHTEDFYLWFSLLGLGALGLLVAFQPFITHTWLQENGSDNPSS
jgi:hypothetical protein